MTLNLEERLGELTGQLKGLVPALEKLEERQRDLEKQVTTTETQLKGLQEEFKTHRDKTGGYVRDLYGRTDRCASDGKRQWDAIGAIEKSIESAKSGKESVVQKVWDVAKIFLAALLGAYLAHKFKGGP